MGERTHHGGASEARLVTANIGSDTDDDSSSVQSSSTDNMADVVVADLQGNERDDSEADSDGGSQHEEDSLDDDESRSVDSDSTGSLADFIAPDWEMESGDEGEVAEDDDYENESTDENEEEGDSDGDGDGNGGDDRPKRAYLPNCDAMARLEMIAYHLRRLARESEAETSQRAALLLQTPWKANNPGAPAAPTRQWAAGGAASQRGVGRVATFARLEAGTPPREKSP